MERLKKFAATTQAQLKTATAQINSPNKTTNVNVNKNNDNKDIETLKKENAMLQKNMTNLVEDFTKINLQLNDYKAKVYDLENTKKTYNNEVKQLQKQVNEAEVKLRRKSITLKKTKDSDIVEKLTEENDNYREQVHALKNTVRELSKNLKQQEDVNNNTNTSNNNNNNNENNNDNDDNNESASTETITGNNDEKIINSNEQDKMKIKELMEQINLINKEKDEIASKFDKAHENHGSDLQQLVDKLTGKEEEIQTAKKKESDSLAKLTASQDRLKEMGKKLEMMVNAYQALKKSSAVNSKQQEELNKANARIAELEEQAKSINIDAIHKAHEDKLKKVESEAKGALDGAKARREAEVQSYKDKLGKLETEIKTLKEKVVEMEKKEDFLKNEKKELKIQEEGTQQRLETTKKELNAQRTRATEAEVSLAELTATAKGYENDIKELKVQMEVEENKQMELKQQLKEANDKMEEVHNDHSETRKKLDDQSMEHKIAGKRQVRMIKDLKSHLKKEAKSKELLEEKLKSTTNVLARLQEEMANSVPVVAPQQPEKEDNKKTSTTRRPSTLAAMISQTVSGSTSSSTTSNTNTNTPESSKPAADDGVKKLLAMRLESLLEENVRIKEKVSMLESIVQDLTLELNDVKEAKSLGLDDNNNDDNYISGDIDDGFEGTVDDDDVESFDI